MTDRKEAPSQYPNIFKILVQNSETGKWMEPTRGKKFKARRYEKRTNGTFERIKRSFETLAEARAFCAGAPVERESEAPEPTVSKVEAIPPRSEKMTLGELAEKWKLNWLPNKDLSTQIRYKSYLKHFKFLWDMTVDEIEPRQIDAWITHIKTPFYLEQGHSTRCTYDHEASVLRIILNYYSSRFNRNYRLPFIRDHSGMLKVKNKTAIRKDLTVEQFRAFLTAFRANCWGTKWEAIYYLAYMQYAIYGRIQDAAALHVEDFDQNLNRLVVQRKVQWLRAKGYEDRIVAGSKTNGGKILSPIPELASQILKEWMMRSGIRSGLLFRINGELITYRQIESKYTQALKQAGLPFSATHILRHASLTEAYDTCQDLLIVQRLGGQVDLRSTTRYVKARDSRVTETQRRMDDKVKMESTAPELHGPQMGPKSVR